MASPNPRTRRGALLKKMDWNESTITSSYRTPYETMTLRKVDRSSADKPRNYYTESFKVEKRKRK